MASVYDRAKAVEYALYWAIRRNADFPDYSGAGGGGDCTNFVSQCMLAGGWTMNPQVPNLKRHHYTTASSTSRHGSQNWWCDGYSSAVNWAVADAFAKYLVNSGRGTVVTRNALARGDIAGVKGPDGRFLHLLLVTHVIARNTPTAEGHRTNVYVASHSRDYLLKDLHGIEMSYGNLEYWKVATLIP
ncbi:MAG: amidase domain-containing protein [Acidobacteria bacterium]|nr:amidase domain-containing protein [Acidobacteriota bacterium]